MATVKGVWVFNETLTFPSKSINEYVNFTSNSQSCSCMMVGSSLRYMQGSTIHVANSGSSWNSTAYRTVDFGETEKTVSDDFYNWLSANAVTQSEEEPDTAYQIKGSTLTAIADAIRAKKEITTELTPAQMAMEIEGIEVGGSIPANARLYYVGNAESTFDMANLIFESSAVGALSE